MSASDARFECGSYGPKPNTFPPDISLSEVGIKAAVCSVYFQTRGSCQPILRSYKKLHDSVDCGQEESSTGQITFAAPCAQSFVLSPPSIFHRTEGILCVMDLLLAISFREHVYRFAL